MSQPTVTVVERWCPGRCLVFSDTLFSDVTTNSYSGGEMVTTLRRVSDVTTNSYSGGEMVSRSVVFSDNTAESQRCHNQQLQWWRDGVPVGSV